MWPSAALIELTGTSYTWSPKAFFITVVSARSPKGVDVPWALT
jgi:hypothetical protein